MTVEHFDAIVIGAGQAGVPLCSALARSGRTTALIERAQVGGTCINSGCTPTKTLIASGRVAHVARHAAEYGVHAAPIAVDFAAVRQRTRDMVTSFRAGTERRIAAEVRRFAGEGRFAGPKTIEVRLADGGTQVVTADLVFINTGARPAPLNLPGLEAVPHLDSTSIMELDALPEHLLVIGGGYIGLEFGQLFRRLGSRVTLVARAPQVLAGEDEDVAEVLTSVLREDGVEILLNTRPVRVSGDAPGTIHLAVHGPGHAPGEEQILRGSHLLVAVGRVPNTEVLNLTAAGIAIGEGGHVRVNERLETSVPGVYALGDVTGGPAFTHVAYDDFRVIRANLLDSPNGSHGSGVAASARVVPYVLYTDPQLGRVGLSERQARARGLPVRVARMPMDYISRAVEIGETRGLIKVLVDPQSRLILGAAVLGAEGGELMAMLEIAMLGQMPYTLLREAVFAHPSLAEGLNTLFMQLD